ncbi:MAG: phage minor head protein [Ahrensia sp.]|nr:phage minor head protein [Ahrensia sp.]
MSDVEDALDLPFDEAISFFRQKTNTPTKSWRDVWGAAHSHSFMVAGATSDALLADFRTEIDLALSEGSTLESFRKRFDEIVAKHGWDYRGERNWRSRVIFETNLRTAYAAGRYAQMTLPATTEAFPYWQYNHSGAINARKAHLAQDGRVYRWNDPVWRVLFPPNGFGCGCFVTVVSQSDLRRMGRSAPDHAGDLRLPQGGYQGVDDGFDYNAGQTWLSGGRPNEPLASTTRLLAFQSQAVAGAVSERASVAIAEAPNTLLNELALPAGTRVRLTAATIRDHLAKRAIDIVQFMVQARRAMGGGIRRREDGSMTAIVDIDGRPHVIGFKATANGELLVTTLYPASTRQIRRISALPRI